MTTYINQDIRWYVGEIHVACHAKSATFTNTCEALDDTTLCDDGWRTFDVPGIKSGAFDLSLLSDMADDGLDERMWALLGTTGVSHSFSIGSADGSLGYTGKTLTTSYTPIEGDPGELAMAKAAGQTTGPLVRGLVLHPHTTARTSSSTGTGRQLGAVSATQRLYASLHVIEVSGTTPSLTVKVQSDDNSGFTSATDRITFTAATDETYQTSSVVGAVTDDYWRITWAVSGTSPSFKFAVIAGIG